MNISGLIRSFIGDTQAAEPKKLELKAGEVVKGAVQQLLPNDEAMLNIGGVQVRAKLETPLKQGEVTFFQVQPETSGGQIILKPLQSSGVQIADGSLPELLKNVGLPDTGANRQLIQALHQAGVALVKETVQAFVQLQSQMPASLKQEEWLPSAIVAFQKGAPLTPDSVLGIKQAISGPAFHETLKQLEGQLSNLFSSNQPLSGSTQSVLNAFRQVLSALREASGQVLQVPEGTQMRQETLQGAEGLTGKVSVPGVLEGQAGQPEANAAGGPEDSIMQGNALKAAPRNGAAPANASSVEQTGVSQGSDSLLTASTADRGLEKPTQAPSSDRVFPSRGEGSPAVPAGSMPGGNQPALGGDGAELLAPGGEKRDAAAHINSGKSTVSTDQLQPNNTAAQSSGQEGAKGQQASLKPTVLQGEMPVTARSSDSVQAATMESNAVTEDTAGRQSNATRNATENKINEALSPTSSSTVPSKTDHWIPRLFKALGIEHESQLLKLPEMGASGVVQNEYDEGVGTRTQHVQSNPETLKMTDTLKSTLLQIIQSDDIPASMKDTAQQAVNHITGQQLMLTSDKTSMFSHITLFVPLMNANGEQTAAIHIQSRKGKRGEIDSQNCRLVFDLRMKNLGDTMVDVQVVDRIVSLNIHNDQPYIQQLLEAHREDIASSLSGIGYQFISLKCSPYPERGQDNSTAANADSSDLAALSNPLQAKYGSKPYKGMDLRV